MCTFFCKSFTFASPNLAKLNDQEIAYTQKKIAFKFTEKNF